MTQGFVPVARQSPPSVASSDITVAPPPELAASTGRLIRLLPVGMSIATVGVMAVAFLSGSGMTRNPSFLAFPMMMLGSAVVTAVAGRGQRQGRGMHANRVDYFGYLTRLRQQVAESAAAQRSSLDWTHPDPGALWTLIGGTRMWERRSKDWDFALIRIGTGTQPLARRLVTAEMLPDERRDPVTVAAMQRLIRAHSTIDEVPTAIGLRDIEFLVVEGNLAEVRGLLRAMACQLAVLHAPDQLLIAGVISDGDRAHWDWLKWLPHNQHPTATDSVGPARMMYRSPERLQTALAGLDVPYLVVIADLDEPADFDNAAAVTHMTVLAAGSGGPTLVLRYAGEADVLESPDQLSPMDTLICARRLAGYRVETAAPDPGWTRLIGFGDAGPIEPHMLWRSQADDARLRVPLGTTADGVALELDIKESSEGGMGPHGLCVGATGSGKSELLRTVALGMITRNSPEVLNLLLIDFKGGATFLDLARAPHVAAIITNLSEEAPLVARMRDALAGEMNRRQQLLRSAGHASVTRYQQARRAGAQLTALPTLFIIVDEFSELLSQHPDFADMFVTIGRLGRSLGMHLLLASQRLEEGRLRGLEAHLSYRMCLKTLSASESRTVLGTADAYQLPNTPGAGFLRLGSSEPMQFQTAFVSGPLRLKAPTGASEGAHRPPVVQPFTADDSGPVAWPDEFAGPPDQTLLRAVVDGLVGQGPPAHQVWLPPLGPAPPLERVLRDAGLPPACLTAPIGIVDRPFEQCRTPLVVDLSGAAGNLAVVGAPQSGKSTALRTVITALSATHDPAQVQFYCLDFGGTLASVRALPHVGAVAGRTEPQLVARIIAEIESLVRTREAIYCDRGIDSIGRYRQLRANRRELFDEDPFGDVFLVVDGWGSLRREFGGFEESITDIAAQGLSFGIHVILSASRWAEIRAPLRDQIGTRVELRLGDPADSELDRKRAQDVPHDRPGRGLSRDGLQMVVCLPIDCDAQWHGFGELVAPPIPLLSTQVDYPAMVEHAGHGSDSQILIGLEDRRLRPVPVDFERDSHLLILGDSECGKTAALRILCREIIRTKTVAQARLLVVDFRRSLLGVIETEHLAGYAMSSAALDESLPNLLDLLRRRMPSPDASQAQLRTRSWWSGPDIYVVVDDYDLVVTATVNPLIALLEYLPYARDVGLHLIIARRSGGATRALFEPLLAGLRDLGCLGLMMSGRPDEASLLGRPTRLPPGRGVLITRTGEEQLIQVAWCPAP